MKRKESEVFIFGDDKYATDNAAKKKSKIEFFLYSIIPALLSLNAKISRYRLHQLGSLWPPLSTIYPLIQEFISNLLNDLLQAILVK